MPHGVNMSWLWSLSLCHVGVAVTCCTTWGVMVVVVAPHGVSWLWLLCRVGCRGCGCCATWGVVVAVAVLRRVLWLWLLHHVGCCHCRLCAVCSVGSPSLRHVGCCGHGCCTAGGVVVVAPCAMSRCCGHCTACSVAV